MKNIVIIGSGLSGLMIARMVRKYKYPEANITIIEKESTIGGQFGSIDYGKMGWFDYGMHIYYETCIPEIDELFTGLLSEEYWNILIDNKKDIAGIFFNGKLQTDTPYPDLRSSNLENLQRYIGDLFLTHALPERKSANAYEVLLDHFGKSLTDEVFVPILQKLYYHHPANLDEIATLLTAINRVALFDTTQMSDLMKSEFIRARVCYPDQHHLVGYRTNPQRGFYPKRYGMQHVLDTFKDKLIDEGCTLITDASVTHAGIENNRLHTLTYKVQDKETIIQNVDTLYWTAGLPGLAGLLKLKAAPQSFDKREPASYVNLVLSDKPDMDLLYYFYCFDAGYRTFRVTNYSAYCPEAVVQGKYPVCLEIWPQPGDSINPEDVVSVAIQELISFGVIQSKSQVVFSAAEKVHGGGFPLPTLNNIGYLNSLRDSIQSTGMTNVVPVGVLAEPNVFFIKDVLIDAYKKVIHD